MGIPYIIMKMFSIKKLSIFPAALLLLSAGCSDRPKDILDEDKMVLLMADIQIAEAYDQSGQSRSDLNGMNREMLGRGILMEHGVSVEQMDSTLAWYGRNMDEYAKLYKRIDEELSRQQQAFAKAAGESENSGPTADLWPYGRHLVVDKKSYADGIIVNLPATDLAPGDKLTWKMRAKGATSHHMTLGVDYEDGTTGIMKNAAYGSDDWVQASIQTDSLLTVERIFGIVNMEHTVPRVFIDSIQLIHQPFNREEYHKTGYQRKVGAARRKTILPPDSTSNSSLTPDSIKARPSLSIEKSLGVKTRR